MPTIHSESEDRVLSMPSKLQDQVRPGVESRPDVLCCYKNGVSVILCLVPAGKGIPVQLRARIQVRRTPQAVWKYLSDHGNIPAWDRGVGSVRENPETLPGVGFEFSTLGTNDRGGSDPEQAKMTYRIAEADPVNGCRVQLISTEGNARYFRNAEWIFNVLPDPEGALIICTVRFTLRIAYLFLAPVLFCARNAIFRDLTHLKKTLENESFSTDARA